MGAPTFASHPPPALSRRSPDPDARDRLAALAPRVTTNVLAGERSLPVHDALQPVLPQGLARGTTALVRGTAAVSTAALLAAAACRAGAWLGVAGLDALGPEACREAGVPLERLVLVRGATALADDAWGQVLGALVDGFDLVLVGAAPRLRQGTARRVQARLQQRGAVLLVVGAPGAFSCDLTLTADPAWDGLGEGHGHLRTRQVRLVAEGRRMPRARRTTLWFPGPLDPHEQSGEQSGEQPVRSVEPPSTEPTPLPLRRTG